MGKMEARFGFSTKKIVIEKLLYPEHITFWCVFRAGDFIGPYFFENQPGATISVNGLRYQTTINKILWPELEDMDVDDVYFHQDGATCHTLLDFFLWGYVKDKVYTDTPQSI